MRLLNTKHKRKSAIITISILLFLVLVILNYGMKYLDPPEEYGIAINFGISDIGAGESKENPKVTKSASVTKQETVKEAIDSDKTTKEKLITQENKDVPVVSDSDEKKEKSKKPSKEAQKAFDNLLKGNASDGKPKGEGDDNQQGLKGKEGGDPKSSKYYGNKGDGGDSNYNLSGRKALSKPIEKPDCQEEGIVVVRIEVDKNGKVIEVTPGVKGTTNSAPCLLKPARIAAMKTTWNVDKNAPSKQRGTIIYKFSLSE